MPGTKKTKAASVQIPPAYEPGVPTPPDWPADATTLPGRDHRTLLEFIEDVEKHYGGDVRKAANVGCPYGYPGRMREKRLSWGEFAWDGKAGTRYDDGRVDPHSDDWDCLADLERWGFVEDVPGALSTGFQPVVRLTDKGRALYTALSRARGERILAERAKV